jgi:hypothetical protein
LFKRKIKDHSSRETITTRDNHREATWKDLIQLPPQTDLKLGQEEVDLDLTTQTTLDKITSLKEECSRHKSMPTAES